MMPELLSESKLMESIIPVSTLICASTSQKRAGILRYCLPEVNIITQPGGQEDNYLGVKQIAEGKINYVLQQPNDNADVINQAGIIAADTQTVILVMHGNQVQEVSLGKLKYGWQIKQVFINMALAARKENVLPWYRDDAATAFKDPGSNMLITLSNTYVSLKPERVEYFATTAGLRHYLEAFKQFYLSAPYVQNGYQSMSPFDISAGLSLPVLSVLGAVEAVNGVVTTSPDFSEAFKTGLYTSAVGIDPKIIQRLSNQPVQLTTWPWLSDVTTHTLSTMYEHH